MLLTVTSKNEIKTLNIRIMLCELFCNFYQLFILFVFENFKFIFDAHNLKHLT